MKKKTEIEVHLKRLKQDLFDKQKEYNNLSQITCIDSYGKKLDDEIQILKGSVKSLEWVLF